jgi:hypothetical protein
MNPPLKHPDQAQLLAQAIKAGQPTPAYDTQLTPEKEAVYQAWLQQNGMTADNGWAMTPQGAGTDYNMRGFFDKYGAVDHKTGQHFTDEFKLPNHESFSDQSNYAVGPAGAHAGSWDDADQYVRPKGDPAAMPASMSNLPAQQPVDPKAAMLAQLLRRSA